MMMEPTVHPFTRFIQFVKDVGNGLLDFGSAVALALDDGYTHIDSLRVYCTRYGWCFTPDFPLHELLTSAFDMNESTSPQHTLYKRFRTFLLSEDAKELRAIVTSFADSPSLGNQRIKILKDCVYALQYHTKDRFNAANLVVPTLLSVIDGVICDFAIVHLGIENWHRSRKTQIVKRELETVCYSFDRSGISLLFDVLFSPAYATTLPASGRRFNRHQILHGNWLEYGRLEHVLRAFLLVFFTVYIIDEYIARKFAGTSEPVTERSTYSKLLSTNIVADIKGIAIGRLASRGHDTQNIPK